MARRLPRRRHRLRATSRGVGAILLVGAAVMVASSVVGLLYGEWWATGWLLAAAAITATAGWLAQRLAHDAREFDLRDAMTTAGAGWAALAVFGGLPFLLAATFTPDAVMVRYVPAGSDAGISSLVNFRDPLHAVFESMSGWTTTGLTLSVDEPTMPHALLMYRSLMQWAGGIGVIVLALSVFQQHGGVQGLFLYQAEARQQRLRPSIVETARRVWRVYVVVTAVLVVYLFLGLVVLLPDYPITSALFDAVNHAMTGQATGGFSTLDDSIAGYGSAAVEWLHLLPMISGAIALPVHYLAIFGRRPAVYWRDIQNRVLFPSLAVGSILVAGLLRGGSGVPDPVRDGVFQFVSAMTGTGWQTADPGRWPVGAVLVVVIGMVVGGAAGSTVGGIKLLRAIYLTRGAWWRVQEMIEPPSAVRVFRIGDRVLRRSAFETEVGRSASFFFLWIVGLTASILVMAIALPGEPGVTELIFESASAQDTVGLSTGITAPDMPASVETMFILQMWLGRLEIVPVLLFLRTLVRQD